MSYSFRAILLLVVFFVVSSVSAAEILHNQSPEDKFKGIVFWPEGTENTEDFIQDFESFVRQGLVPQGINTIVFDMHWDNYQFTSVPELDALKRMARSDFHKKDAVKMAAICREHGIRVIVGMNFLTHQNYGQLLRAFPELTWPGKENLWDPLNPKVNQVVFKMVDELVEAFNPDAFHVGMDEGWGFDADNHPGNKTLGLSSSELLAKAIKEYHAHIVGHHKIEMMMWSDMLEGRHKDIHVEETLDLIPKDIIMVSWNYDRQVNYPWPKKLIDKGFRVIVSPYKDVLAAEKFLKQSIRDNKKGLLGVLYTTWARYVVTDLADALSGKKNTAHLNEEMVGVSKTLSRTIYLFK